MKKRKDAVLRLKGVLARDKSQIPDGFTAVIARDVRLVLDAYMDVENSKVSCELCVGQDGTYELKLQANATRLKNLPIII